MAEGEFVLLCGDGIVPNIVEIDKILDSNFEITVIYGKKLTSINKFYLNWGYEESKDKNSFFEKNYSQITLYGGTICRKDLIDKIDIEMMCDKYLGTGFIYPSALAIYSEGPYKLHVGDFLGSLNSKGSPGWILNGKAIEVWTKNFCVCLDSLTGYLDKNARDIIIKENGRRTGFLTFKGLIWLKATNNYDSKVYNKYKTYIHRCIACNKLVAFMIAYTMPKSMCKLIRIIYKKLNFKGKGKS